MRLVKGAYWDHEIVESRRHGWAVPVFEDKAECDRNFEALTRWLIDAQPAVRVAVASHNLRSVAHAIAYNRMADNADEDLELQVLRGLGDGLQSALAEQGLRVRTYCPVGDLVAGMAYLVRRLLENTSNESFLHEQARGHADRGAAARAMTREIPIRGDMIRLGQLLKLAGAVDAGGEAKELLAAGGVRVNGEVEERRGRQLHPGDEVLVGDDALLVVAR